MGKESFVKKSLDDDEMIIAIARITRWKFLDEILWAVLFCCIVITLIFLQLGQIVAMGAAFTLFIVWDIMSAKDFIYINMTILSITTRKIVYRTGFLKTRGVDIPLRNVDNVQVSYSVLGKIFNYGKIRIESRSEPIEVNWVYNPTRFKNLIDRAAQGYVSQRTIG
ncbi:MAG: PH domain-containing protein [Clostridiales bacterium]|jgi:uncharacterized membrane protein YdbT with pleckstrin-like domain|nr:PH domain-containing protein [Clostridiales bacterium]